jgi:hypothetical protein
MLLELLTFREDEIGVDIQAGVDEGLPSKGKEKKGKSK